MLSALSHLNYFSFGNYLVDLLYDADHVFVNVLSLALHDIKFTSLHLP